MSRTPARLSLYDSEQCLYVLVLPPCFSALEMARLASQELKATPQASHAELRDRYGNGYRIGKKGSSLAWLLLYLRLL
ncbi:hypothetical protein PVT67_05930 [Gallaecimonas kandeliae]|uniref:hypothetical protein n=1 Tax=Gallaecimonas kandeliae TaxID=3029055 RepID=UPI00264739B1|nr:hypothetical protein [Gallaecimonas kandeliae]WKE66778.1 hypothetical protein PVT67_05930 [Gallaecimonas kandeliae]